MFKRKKKVFFEKRKNKVSFERNRQLMNSIDTACGTFILWDKTKKKGFKEFIFKITVPRLLFTFSLLSITTLIITKFALISIIMCGSFAGSVFGIYGTLIFFMSKKHAVKELLQWCESIYDVKKKYHKSIHALAETKLIEIENLSYKCLKWLRIIMYGDAVFVTLVFGIISQFLPENIYPRLTPPLPFYLPYFEDQKTWMSLICTTFVQFIVCTDVITITFLLYGSGIGIFIHILGFMDIIQLAAETWKEELLKNIKNIDFKSSTSQQLTTSNLGIINVIEANANQSFDQWIQILNDMICDVNSIIVSADNVYSFGFLFNELAGLGSLFISGLIFTVVHEQYSFAIGVTIVNVLLYIACYMNEQVLEKFENINQTLYDIPWYTLTPNQRKSLMILMHCDKINQGLMVAKIHGLTFERFGIIVKAGYTNMLVLRDLIQK